MESKNNGHNQSNKRSSKLEFLVLAILILDEGKFEIGKSGSGEGIRIPGAICYAESKIPFKKMGNTTFLLI